MPDTYKAYFCIRLSVSVSDFKQAVVRQMSASDALTNICPSDVTHKCLTQSLPLYQANACLKDQADINWTKKACTTDLIIWKTIVFTANFMPIVRELTPKICS